MSMDSLKLMKAMGEKMNFLEERQKVLAQNVANADTPGYRPMEIKTPDFKNLLNSSSSSISMSASNLATTNRQHLGLGGVSADGGKVAEKTQKRTYEVAPAGNAVVLEEQLLLMNENFTDHRFITNLYQKNIDMMKTAVKSQ